MDVMKQLHSILAPPPVPAIRTRSAPANPETPAAPSFAATLAEAGLKPAGAAPAAREEIAVRDTLASLTDQAVDTEPVEVELPVPEVEVPRPAPVSTGTVATDVPKAPKPSLLPPIGVQWVPVALRGTGASGHGVAGTDEAMARQLAAKHEQYTDPNRFGMSLNVEAYMFLDAVEKGYVPNSPEGLGTLLGYLGQGAMGPEARPPQMTEYFRQFFETARAQGKI